MSEQSQSGMIIYQTEDGLTKIDVAFENDTVWLSLEQMAELFQRDRTVIGRHIKNVFSEGELQKNSVCAKFAHTAADGKTYQVDYYNLDMIISVGYRVKSQRGVQFRIWASGVIKEYMKKGFAIDDQRLKELGGGNYFHELLERIRDIRASEKVFYRQVLEIYATSIDYDPRAEISLDEKELKAMGQLVSGYLDFAERQAERKQAMSMADWAKHLDGILTSTGEKLLTGAGSISHEAAMAKAETEYKKYKNRILSNVEKDYLQSMKLLEDIAARQ